MVFKSNHQQPQIRANEIKWMRQWETKVKNCKNKEILNILHTHIIDQVLNGLSSESDCLRQLLNQSHHKVMQN